MVDRCALLTKNLAFGSREGERLAFEQRPEDRRRLVRAGQKTGRRDRCRLAGKTCCSWAGRCKNRDSLFNHAPGWRSRDRKRVIETCQELAGDNHKTSKPRSGTRTLMPTRILDTQVLISHYNKMTKSKSVDAVKAHARQLINIENTNWILSPIRIEFLCGVRDSHERKLYCACLEQFEVLDERKIPSQDWSEAERLAQWVKQDGRGRKLGDCLIQAIAKRLHAEVTTTDPDFPQRTPPKHSSRAVS